MTPFEQVSFDPNGLVPVVAQEARTGVVLMLAYANREALEKTLASGRAHYWSRSRQELWAKGDTSGNVQELVEMRLDCDGDAVLYLVRQTGPACHTGNRDCFFRLEEDGRWLESAAEPTILSRVDGVIADRSLNPQEGSYTNYLLDKGLDKILKKVGEEATEVVIAAKNPDDDELLQECSDLLYHLVVMLRSRNVPLEKIWTEMDQRFGRAPRAKSDRTEAPAP